MNDSVKVISQDSGIMHIQLNRPQQLNALSQEVLQTLSDLFHQAKDDPLTKALLISGEGKAFCAGADIKQLAELNGSNGLQFAHFGQDVFHLLDTLGKPSLAAIHGFAFGGGCELAMAATLRIASDTAVFGQPEIKLGVIPGFGGTQRLARLVGKGRALDLCLSGRRFTAQEAYQWGLINIIVPPDQLIARAKEYLSELVKMSSIAMQSIITVIQQGYDMPLEEGLELEAAHFGLCCTTSDKKEGVSAFLEKRAPVFNGN